MPERYKFEIQIFQEVNAGVKAVTYSYKQTEFYAKAEATGIFTSKTKNLLLQENQLVEIKMGPKSEACAMTCYLEYSKIGKLETLEGTFISENTKSKNSCGNGRVYLEKVEKTEFVVEDFLKKKAPIAKNPPSKSNITQPKSSSAQAPKTNSTAISKKPAVKPGAEDNLINQSTSLSNKLETGTHPSNNQAPEKVETPTEIKPKIHSWDSRNNKLVKEIKTEAQKFTVQLYDNGEIDDDTISVYHNGVKVIDRKRLSYQALEYEVNCISESNKHEIIVAAENQGRIPPNTALAIIIAGKNKYELTLSTTNQTNARIVIECNAKPPQ